MVAVLAVTVPVGVALVVAGVLLAGNGSAGLGAVLFMAVLALAIGFASDPG